MFIYNLLICFNIIDRRTTVKLYIIFVVNKMLKYIKTAYGMGYQWIGGEPR